MSTAVVPYAAESLSDRMRYAETLASAAELIPKGLWSVRQAEDGRMLPPSPSPGKVLLVLEAGAMLGVHPVAALNGIHIIENKTTISPALMSAVVRGAGHKLRVRTEGSVQTGDLVGIAELIRADDPEHPFEARFSLDDALSAELIQSIEQDEAGRYRIVALSENGKALAWQKTPRNLVKRRAISEVCRDGAEDVLMGIHYTPEEIGATVDDSGEYIPPTEVPVEKPEAPAPSATPPARKRATRGAQGTKRKPAEAVVDAEVVEAEPVPEGTEVTPENAGAVVTEDGVEHVGEIPAENTGTAIAEAEERRTKAEQADRDLAEAAEAEERARIAAEQEAAARADADDVAKDEDVASFLQEPTCDEPAADEPPRSYEERVKAAKSLPELKAIWDALQGQPEFTKAMSDLIVQRKGAIEEEEAKAAAAATESKPSATRAAVLGD